MRLFVFLASCFLFSNCGGDIPSNIQVKLSDPKQQATFDCPLEGTAKTERIKAFNRLKNRTNIPLPENFDTSVSIEKMALPGNDADRWKNTSAAKIVGYVSEVKTAGAETCNCGAKEQENRDTHIELVVDPMNSAKYKVVVIEISPRMRKIMKEKGVNWSTRAIRDNFLGRWVEVEGWLFYDGEHANMAENTNPGRERNWRATAWEIHPVTAIKVINKPIKR